MTKSSLSRTGWTQRTRRRIGNLIYPPTWPLSTNDCGPSITEEANYVVLEEILFCPHFFEESYTDQCIRQDSVLAKRNVPHKRKCGSKKNAAPQRRACSKHSYQKLREYDLRNNILNIYLETYVEPLGYGESDLLPQFGPEVFDDIEALVTSLSAFAGETLTDGILSHIEGLCALLISLRGTTDYISAGGIIFLYLKRFTDRSLTGQVLKYLDEFFTPQSGLENGDSNEETNNLDWIEMMKNLHSNWSYVKDNKLFSHLSKVLGVIVTMELCKASDVTFTIRDMKLFEPDLKVIHGNSIDVIDAALSSVSFFVEVFSLCIERKSLKPLIVNDTAAVELDEEFAQICAYWDLVQNGNLRKIKGISDSEFDRRLENLTSRLRGLIPGLKGFDKKIVQDKFAKLLSIKNDYITMKISSGIRKAPFTVELFGPSSQGKSTICEQIIAALLTSADLPTGKEYQANFNAGDRYMSTWTTSKTVMVVDDIANEKSNFVQAPPTRAIIDLCNNQAFYANMADLASKGKVFVEPEIVMVTTNVKDLDARAYSNCPYSIQRRMHAVVTVKAKPEFQFKDSRGVCIGVDSELVDQQYEDLSDPPMFDDIWHLTVERAVMPEKLSSRADYEVLNYGEHTLKNASFNLVLNYLIDRFHRHIKNQQNMLARMKLRQRHMDLCGVDGCKQIKGHCMVHTDCVCTSNPDISDDEDDYSIDSDTKRDLDALALHDAKLYASDNTLYNRIFGSRSKKGKAKTNKKKSKSSPKKKKTPNVAKMPKKGNLKEPPAYSLTPPTPPAAIPKEQPVADYPVGKQPPQPTQAEVDKRQEAREAHLTQEFYSQKEAEGNFDHLRKMDEEIEVLKKEGEAHSREKEEQAQILGEYEEIPILDIDVLDDYVPIHDKDFLEAENNQPHWGEEIVESINKSGRLIHDRLSSDLFGISSVTEAATSFAIMRAGRKFAKHWDWLSIVPTPWLNDDRFQKLCMYACQDRLKRNYMRNSLALWTFVGLGNFSTRKCWKGVRYSCLFATLIGGFHFQKFMSELVQVQFRKELSSRNEVSPVLAELRNKHVTNLCKAGGIIAALYGMAKVYRAWRRNCNLVAAQSPLQPESHEEVELRNNTTNPWVHVQQRPLPVHEKAQNTTSDHLEKIISKNLTYGSVETDEGMMAVNCLFLRSNLVVMPQHYFKKDTLKVKFHKCNPTSSGGSFESTLSKNTSYFVPNTDLALCYVPNGGSYKLISRYLPTGPLSRTDFKILYRMKVGDLTVNHGLADPAFTGHSLKKFDGLDYKSLTINTFHGMCGAVLTATHKPLILGFHLGGQANTPRGCAGILTQEQYEEGLRELRKIETVMLTGTAEHFEKKVMDTMIDVGESLHKKSPLNFMPHESQISWHGSCKGHTTFKSRAKPTLITEHVMDVMGQPNIYCKPIESPQWKPWQTCLENMSHPGRVFDPTLLQIAAQDYKSELLPIFANKMWNLTRPLDDVENWNGVPGQKFLDRIKANTSVGFPLSGRKEKYLVEIEPFGDYTKLVEPEKVIRDEINRLLECYRNEERAYPVAKACKKDEIVDKEKCRIFFSNPVALTFLVRKYFLPLLRVLQFYPKLSECAVGVNSHGPEWEELHQHIFTFGENRLIGGDYGKYDQKLPSQLLLASFRILIDFARVCKYTEEDITIMETMAGDIVFAIIALNGDLIGLNDGSHISGNSLTVILNGICGSLNLRCYFYHNNPPVDGVVIPFRKKVKLITYGDDNIGSVHEDIDNFTIKGASEFLEEHGQVYTMPDKESELTNFLPPEEFEFLKRKSVFHPDLGVHIGALVDKSCFKMLHYYVRDKGAVDSEPMACAKNLDTACREWFNHGRDVYEMRRDQLLEVAERANIAHLCEELNVTYDGRVENWKDSYL